MRNRFLIPPILLLALPLAGCGSAMMQPAGDPAQCDPAAATDPMRGFEVMGDLQPGETSVELGPTRGFAGYRFRAARGQQVTLTASSAMDTYLIVYGPEADGAWGAPVMRDDNADGTNARVQLTAPAEGTYLAVATTRANAAACRAGEAGTVVLAFDPGQTRAPEIGTGDHSPGSVRFTMIMAAGLTRPSGLAFNPNAPNQLWVTNHGNHSLTVIDLSAAEPARMGPWRDSTIHFLVNPTGLSFSDNRTFATCHESRNGGASPDLGNDFMGPVVYPADVEPFMRAGVAPSHLDMLHHSPLCMGIVATGGTDFWVFNGQSGAIDHYRFNEFHPPGEDDHSDGETVRHADGQLQRVPGVPSGMVYDAATRKIYVADTGHRRIVSLDTSVSEIDAIQIPARTRETVLYGIESSRVVDVVSAETGMLQQPSGLALHNGLLFVADNATGRISAFTTSGERVNYLDTGLTEGALSALAFGPDGKLYIANRTANQVLRIDP